MSFDYSLVRSWLFVPGDSQRKIDKGWSFGADALIFDLEDAVAAPNKVAARGITHAALVAANRGNTLVAIRINALDTGMTFDDIDATIGAKPDCYVLPKVMAAEDVRKVSRHIALREAQHGLPAGSVRMMLIITEHPYPVMRLDEICGADPRAAVIMWGSEDLSAAMGARRAKNADGSMLEVFRLVRHLAILAASAHGLAALDTPVVEIEDLEAVARESREAADMGYTAKVAIHPSQVAVINEGFLPDPQQESYSRELLEAAKANSASGTFRFQGKMIDMPHIRTARRMVALADAHRKRAA